MIIERTNESLFIFVLSEIITARVERIGVDVLKPRDTA